jgi:hypothetical protein
LQARSRALARLTDSGLVEVLLGVDPSVEEQLDLASARASVDEELERIMAGEETG